MGAYQHTKPNGYTIPEMNRVTVQWERMIDVSSPWLDIETLQKMLTPE